MTWNPQVVAGIGAVTDPTQLHKDMHAYLEGGCWAPPQRMHVRSLGQVDGLGGDAVLLQMLHSW